MQQAFEQGADLFDQQRFFEAHEFFEYIWKADETAAADRRFWRAVTQIAVACCHVQRGNARGAIAVAERAVDGLQSYPARHRGVHTLALIDLGRCLSIRLRRPQPGKEISFRRFPRLID